MSMGSDTSMEGGFSGSSDGAGYSGYSNPDQVGSGRNPTNIDMSGVLQALFADPESAKAVSDTFGKFANSLASAKKIPPHAAAFMKKSISDTVAKQSGAQANDPYLGDMMRFVSPDVAARTLADLGIPTGRTRF